MTHPLPALRISIIIATWNAERTLAQCLQSIRSQRTVIPEVIVADGGSSDSTCELIETYSDVVTHWWSCKDRGIYDAWNRALDVATGDYVMFIGSDDELAGPHVLAQLLMRLTAEPVDILTVTGRLKSRSGKVGEPFGGRWEDCGLPRWFRVCHPGLVHNRQLFERFGRFKPQFRIAGDLEFATRLPKSVTHGHVDTVIVLVGDEGISRRKFWERLRETREIHKQNGRVGPALAWYFWANKAWRRPIAKWLGLPH